jgi:hypothetical protein
MPRACPCSSPAPRLVNAPLRIATAAERDQLLGEGFSNWMRRDFNAFVRACEKYGRHNLADIARDIETKTEEEVRPAGNSKARGGAPAAAGAARGSPPYGRMMYAVLCAALGKKFGAWGAGVGRIAVCGMTVGRGFEAASRQHVPLSRSPLLPPTRRCAPTPRCSGSGTPRSTTTRRWVEAAQQPRDRAAGPVGLQPPLQQRASSCPPHNPTRALTPTAPSLLAAHQEH